MIKFTNNAKGTLSAGIAAGDLTIPLTAGHGARFPAAAGADYFIGTLIDASNNREIVKVTARATDSLTVLRGQEGTSALAFLSGDRFELLTTAGGLEALRQESTQAIVLAGTDTYTGSLSPLPEALNINQVYPCLIPNANTVTNPTVNLSSLGAKTVKRVGGLGLSFSDLPAAGLVFLLYDGADFILLNPSYGVATLKQTGAFNISKLDRGRVFLCSGSFTVTLDALNTFDTAFECEIVNIGTGTVTIDPNGGELIRFAGGTAAGQATQTLPYSGAVEGPYNVSGARIMKNATDGLWEVITTRECHGSQEFLASGTWTCPAGVTTAWLSACAGGGGGGSATTTGGGADAAGSGGGAGDAETGIRVTVVPGTAYTVTRGAGGAAATAGGTTSVGALLTLTGGTAGVTGADALAGAGGAANGRGAAGHPTVAPLIGGNGGSGPYGGGARGSAGATAVGAAAAANSGAGGGGGTRLVVSGPGTTAGGAGGSGYIKIQW